MNDNDYARKNMFEHVKDFCRNNVTELSTYLPFIGVQTEYEAKLVELNRLIMAQEYPGKGSISDKTEVRKELESLTKTLSSKLFSLALLNADSELQGRVYYTPSTLKLAKETELSGICTKLKVDAEAHLAALASYGIDAPWLDAFSTKNNDFLKLIGKPANARKQRKEATAAIKKLVPEISAYLRNEMDSVMNHFLYANYNLYATYKGMRKIHDAPVQKPMLRGSVKDKDGHPIKGLKVAIEGRKRRAITTEKGNFKFTRMTKGEHNLSILKKRKVLLRMVVMVPGVVELVVTLPLT